MTPYKVGLCFMPMWPTERPMLGLAYIAASLRRSGCEVRIFDWNIRIWNHHPEKGTETDLWLWNSWLDWSEGPAFETEIRPRLQPQLDEAASELVREIKAQGLSAMGFSVFTTNLQATRIVSRRLRAQVPDLRIFWGGPELSQGTCLEDLRDGTVDALVFGEGEESAVELIKKWSCSLPVKDLPGVLTQNDQGSEPRHHRPPLSMDTLPRITFRDFDLSQYKTASLPLMASRGCVAACVFCSEAPMWGKFRYRRVDLVVDEIEEIVSQTGITRFYFSDSLLNGSHGHLMDMAKMILDRRIKISYEGNSRLDPRLTPEVLEFLARSGCQALTFGLESGSQKVLNLMKKGVRLEFARKIIRDTQSAGVQVNVNIVVGFPGEEEADFQDTLNFLEENIENIDFVSTGFGMDVGPGMPLTGRLEKFDVRLNSQGEVYRDAQGQWTSRDGRNNYRERLKRVGRLWKHLDRLGLPYHPKGVKSVKSRIIINSRGENYAFEVPLWENEMG